MPHLRFEPCQVLLDLEVVEVFRHRSFLEVVVEVFRRRSFLEEVVEGVPFLPQEVEVEEEEEEGVLLRLLDQLEEVSVQSFFAPIFIVGCREIIF